MRSIVEGILGAAVFAAFCGVMVYAIITPDPVYQARDRRAWEEARVYDIEAQQRCADAVLRPYYAAGEPTDEQVAQAYHDCGGDL